MIPNEKIASDTIRNSSIRSRKKLAQVTVPVPLDRDLDAVIGLLREAAGDDEATGAGVRARRSSPPSRCSVLGLGRAGRREARERAAPEGTRPAARGRGVRVSPPPPRGGRRGDDNELESILRRTRRRRPAGKAKRKRRTTLILAVALVVVLALIALGCRRRGGVPVELQPRHAAAGRDRPELVRLRRERLAARLDSRRAEPPPVRLWQRQPVDARRRPSRSRTTASTATAASTTRASHAPPGRTSAPARSCRAARRSRSSSSATSTSRKRADLQAQAQGGLSRDQAEPPLVEGPDPQRVHEPGLLRQPRLRDRGGGADVLLEARAEPEPRPVGPARRPAAGAVAVRPVAHARTPRSHRRDAGAARDATTTAYITAEQYRARGRDRKLTSGPGKLYTTIREPYFFSYVRDQLIAEYGVEHRPLGWAARLHDDQPAPSGRGRAGDQGHALPARTTRRPRSSRSIPRPARSAR